jgi:hypothetical protein
MPKPSHPSTRGIAILAAAGRPNVDGKYVYATIKASRFSDLD